MALNTRLLKDILLAMNDIYNESEGPVGMSDKSFFDKFANMDNKPSNDYSDMAKKFTDDEDNYAGYTKKPGYINGGIPATVRARMQMNDTPEVKKEVSEVPPTEYENAVKELPELPSL